MEHHITSRLSTARALATGPEPLDPIIRAVLLALIDRIDRAVAVVDAVDSEYRAGGSASDAVQDMHAILCGGVADNLGIVVPDED